MRHLLLLLTAITASTLTYAQSAKTPLEEEFHLTEKAALQAFTERSIDKFAKLVDDDAVFVHMGQVMKGKAAAVDFSCPMFTGPAPFTISTTEVTVLPSGLAMTSGPIRSAPDGRIVARYSSVWRKHATDGWKLVFDRSWPAND